MILLEDYEVNFKIDHNNDLKTDHCIKNNKNITEEKKKFLERYLEEFKETINDSDSSGKTILFYAIDTGADEIVTTVLDIPNIDTDKLLYIK